MDDDDDPTMESSFARQQREEYISKKIGKLMFVFCFGYLALLLSGKPVSTHNNNTLLSMGSFPIFFKVIHLS